MDRNRYLFLLPGLLLIMTACQPADVPASVTSTAESPTLAPSPLASTPTVDSPPTNTPDLIDRAAVGAWLDANALPLADPDQGDGYDDLLPLADLIGDARVVALGEGTHGTHEFFATKARMVQFLVEEMGFNIVSMEFSWGPGLEVNEYIHDPTLDSRFLMGGRPIYHTDEVYALLDWLADYNSRVDPSAQVDFYGIDPDFEIYAAIDHIESYIEAVDPDSLEMIQSLYECVPAPIFDFEYVAPAARARCFDNGSEVYEFLESQAGAYSAQTSEKAFMQTLISSNVVSQGMSIWSGVGHEGVVRRDLYMAHNVADLLDYSGPDAKIILWAHDFHVSARDISDEELEAEGLVYRTSGSHLREYYGDDLVIVSFGFDAGEVFSTVPGNFQAQAYGVPPAIEGSYESYLREGSYDQYLLDLRAVALDDPGALWLADPRPYRILGGVFEIGKPSKHFDTLDMTSAYDLLVFFQETSAAHRR